MNEEKRAKLLREGLDQLRQQDHSIVEGKSWAYRPYHPPAWVMSVLAGVVLLSLGGLGSLTMFLMGEHAKLVALEVRVAAGEKVDADLKKDQIGLARWQEFHDDFLVRLDKIEKKQDKIQEQLKSVVVTHYVKGRQ